MTNQSLDAALIALLSEERKNALRTGLELGFTPEQILSGVECSLNSPVTALASEAYLASLATTQTR